MTLVTFLLLSPILCLKQPICKTLYCMDVNNFFRKGQESNDPLLKRTPPPSQSWTYETLLYKALVTRLSNVVRPAFWKTWWINTVLKGNPFFRRRPVWKQLCLIIWLPVCIILLILHAVPFFSVWFDYLHKEARSIFTCKTQWKRVLNIITFIMILVGIFWFYLMIWNFMVSVCYT